MRALSQPKLNIYTIHTQEQVSLLGYWTGWSLSYWGLSNRKDSNWQPVTTNLLPIKQHKHLYKNSNIYGNMHIFPWGHAMRRDKERCVPLPASMMFNTCLEKLRKR